MKRFLIIVFSVMLVASITISAFASDFPYFRSFISGYDNNEKFHYALFNEQLPAGDYVISIILPYSGEVIGVFLGTYSIEYKLYELDGFSRYISEFSLNDEIRFVPAYEEYNQGVTVYLQSAYGDNPESPGDLMGGANIIIEEPSIRLSESFVFVATCVSLRESESLDAIIAESLQYSINWVGTVVDSLLNGSLTPLLLILAVPIAVSALFLGIKVIKRSSWGA